MNPSHAERATQPTKSHKPQKSAASMVSFRCVGCLLMGAVGGMLAVFILAAFGR